MITDIKPQLALLMVGQITIDECEQRIKSICFPQTNNVYANIVFKAIEDVTKITTFELCSKSRELRVVNARKIYAYEMRQKGFTLSEAGKLINRDHATILNLVRKYEQHYKAEVDFNKNANLVSIEIDRLKNNS